MKRWPWVAGAIVTTMGLLAVVVEPRARSPWFISTFVALMAGTFILSKAPRNVIGRLLFAFGMVEWLSGIMHIPFLDADTVVLGWVDAVGSAINTAGLFLLGFLLLRFPTGELLSPRWRYAERLGIFVMTLGAISALVGGGWGGDPAQAVAPSPLRDSAGDLADVLPTIFFPSIGVFFFFSVASIVIRFSRSAGVERQQLKWLAFAAVGLMASLAATGFDVDASTWEELVIPAGISLIPIAIGLAISKYRLFDIDVVISKTIVFGVMVVFIAGIYVMLVVGIGSVLGVGESNLVLSVLSTAVVALAFEPFRLRAQRWANRLVYGTRATPYEVLSDLTSRLSQAQSYSGLLERMARQLADGTGAESAVVWTLDGERFVAEAGYPESPEATVSEADLPGFHVAVEHDGHRVGALSVHKSRGENLTSTELALLDDLAGSAGLVMGKLRLDAQLQQRAKELSESRRRLVHAQSEERRRLERDLHDGAQQLVVSLKVKLGIAAQIARGEEVEKVADLLDSLAGDAQLAIEEIRTLAKGIHPPLLEAEGLGAAIRSIAGSSGLDVRVAVDGLARHPIDVEAAIFYCISEALSNVAKHAPGSPVEIRISESGGLLNFSVADRGPGLANSNGAHGSGLRNMADRIEALGGSITIGNREGGGVLVAGELERVAVDA